MRAGVLIVIVLGLASATLVWRTAGRLDPRFLREPDGNDAWFEADLPIVSDRVLHRWSDQSRNSRHPLFPLLATLPVNALKAAGVSEGTALRTLIAAIAAIWTMAVWVLLHGVTRRWLDALVFTALAHASAAATFWLPVPDTYALGSITVMIPLALCAWDRNGALGSGAYAAAAAISLSITTTNWLTGIAAVVSRKPWRQALQIVANSLTAVVLLWGAQRLIFPTAAFFIGEGDWHGISRARMYYRYGFDPQEPERARYDRPLPSFLGVPWGLIRKAFASLRSYLWRRLRGRGAEAFTYEMWLCFFAGLVVQCRREARQGFGGAARAAAPEEARVTPSRRKDPLAVPLAPERRASP